MIDVYDADKDRISFVLLGRRLMTRLMLIRTEFSSCFWEENE